MFLKLIVLLYFSWFQVELTSTWNPHTPCTHGKVKTETYSTYETARRETTQFVLAVVADNWVRELQDSESIYTEVSTKDLFAHIQTGCTGRHALDLLALHNEIQRYQIEVKGIPGYINMLKDA